MLDAASGALARRDPRRAYGDGPGAQPGRQAALRLQPLRQRRLGDRPGGRQGGGARRRPSANRSPRPSRPTAGRCWWPTTCRTRGPTGRSKATCRPVVTVIDARTHATTAIPLPHGANGLRGLCVSPDGKHAFVTHLLSNFEMVPFRVDMGWINVNVVSIIDVRQRKVIGTIGMDEYDFGRGQSVGRGLHGRREVGLRQPRRHARAVRHRERRPAGRLRPADHAADDGRLADLPEPGREPVAADQAAGQGPARAGRRRVEGLRGRVLQRHRGRGRSARPRRTAPSARSPWAPRRN